MWGASCLLARPRPADGPRAFGVVLLRVELDDQLLLHRRRDLLPLRMPEDLGGEAIVVRLKPGRNRGGQLGGVPEDRFGARAGLQGDHVVGAQLIRRDVDPPAIDRPVAVTDQLTRLPARAGKAESHERVVESRLEQPQQVLAGHAALPRRLGVVVAELLLEHAVVAAGLLLLAQLKSVLRVARATTAVVARRIVPPLDRALVGEAALALEEQLLPLAAALLALRAGFAGHCLDTPPLARSAA